MKNLIFTLITLAVFQFSTKAQKSENQDFDLEKSLAFVRTPDLLLPEKISLFLKNHLPYDNNGLLLKAPNKRSLEIQQLALDFYHRRNYSPAWVEPSGLKPLAYQMLDIVQKDTRHQHLISPLLTEEIAKYEQIIQGTELLDAQAMSRLETGLTLTFMHYAQVLLHGYVVAEQLPDMEWFLPKRQADFPLLLEGVIAGTDLSQTLTNLLPKNPAFNQLAAFHSLYTNIWKRGGWKKVSPKILDVEVGTEDQSVSQLRERLAMTEHLQASLTSGISYDKDVEQAVVRFQKQHGLAPDGRVGKMTLTHLNVPVEERILQLEVNMERSKWLPEQYGKKYIWVNIPNFTLKYIENESVKGEFVVVTGSKQHQTPCFTADMTDVVVNPSWNVPVSIAMNEIIPDINKNANYLKDKNIEIIGGWNTNSTLNDTVQLDWKNKEMANSYRFRQKPGPGNALGQLKFNLPNPWNVYLHDTPSKSYFSRAQRAYSHGCIRVQNPTDLAELILEEQKGWTKCDLEDKMQGRETRTLDLQEPLPVYIVYMTAWVDESGTLQLREDIYGRDKMLATALAKR